ncbi:MAG: glycosyltransferase family 4 protein [Variibacter sp.]|nr:glycosyltransferase family 4 protein [Variibacter sp.]
MTRRRHLNILVTADAVGGVWSYAASVAAGLAERGHSVTLATLGPPPRPWQCEALRGRPGVRLVVTDFALEWMDPAGVDFARARAGLARLEAQVRPDIVHLNSYREAAAEWRAPVLVVAHSCVWTWWRACRGGEPDEDRWRTYRANVRRGLCAADLWAAPSACFRDSMAATYRPATAGLVVHNGVAPVRARRPKEPFILAAGRLWDEAKNAQALASVAASLPWPVVLAGAKDGRIAPSANLRLTEELPHETLMDLMARAEIFVAPALYEPFGLAVLEAAAAGSALVLSDIPVLRELWAGAAVFVDGRDSAGLRDALIALCADDRRRNDLRARARRRAARYTLAAMVDGYCAAYGALADAARSAPRASARTGAPA